MVSLNQQEKFASIVKTQRTIQDQTPSVQGQSKNPWGEVAASLSLPAVHQFQAANSREL
jgi:hypothetical protein